MIPCAACHAPTERADLIAGLCGLCFGEGAPVQAGHGPRWSRDPITRRLASFRWSRLVGMSLPLAHKSSTARPDGGWSRRSVHGANIGTVARSATFFQEDIPLARGGVPNAQQSRRKPLETGKR
jgi:hypothetical protein